MMKTDEELGVTKWCRGSDTRWLAVDDTFLASQYDYFFFIKLNKTRRHFDAVFIVKAQLILCIPILRESCAFRSLDC